MTIAEKRATASDTALEPVVANDGSHDGLAVERISAALRKDLLHGRIGEGDPLRQDSIARRFNTSRVPVREALRLLEAEGLVVFHPRRGASVASVDPAQLLEMFDIRIALECYLLRLAVPNMTQVDIDEARALIDVSETSYSHGEWDDMNWAFHARLYLTAHRPAMFRLVESNYLNQARSARMRIAAATGQRAPHAEHEAILAACEAGDAERAAALLQAHIVNARKAVATELHRTELNSRRR